MSKEYENSNENSMENLEKEIAGEMEDMAKGIKDNVGGASQDMAKDVKDNIGGASQDAAKGTWNNISDKTQDMVKNLKDSAANKTVQDFAKDVKDNVGSTAQDIAKDVKDNVTGKAQDFAKDVKDNVAGKTQDMAKGVRDNVAGRTQDVAKSVKHGLTTDSKEAGKKKITTREMVTIAMLAAVSIILSFFEIQIPIFPSFLKLDIADLPTVIGAIAFGPIGGILVTLIRNLVQLTRTTTGGVGDFANFVMACSLCIPLCLIFRKFKNFKGYVLGSVVGVIVMAAVACLLNYNILIPLFSALFGAPIEAFVGMAQEFNSHVVDLKTLVLFSIGPFNLLKGAIIVIISYPLWKALKKVIRK